MKEENFSDVKNITRIFFLPSKINLMLIDKPNFILIIINPEEYIKFDKLAYRDQ